MLWIVGQTEKNFLALMNSPESQNISTWYQIATIIDKKGKSGIEQRT